mgnify:CR=1 FL=1
MRIGVAGCGYWGPKHVRVLESINEVDQVVVIDPDESARKAITQSYPRVLEYADLSSALPEIDALVVATPPRKHAQLAFEALDAGKHILVEKPFTTSSDDARELIRTARDSDLVLMVGHTFEYNPVVWRLRDAVNSGELGDVHYIDTARLNLGLYQPDVNVVWDLAPHDISILNYVLQARPTSVEARGYSCAGSKYQDVAYISIEYADIQAEANVHVSWLDPCKVRRVTVVGSEKMAVYNDVSADEKLRIYDKGVAFDSDGQGQDAPAVPLSYRYGSIVSPFIDFREPLRVEDEHFVDCIKTGARPSTDGENGLAVVEVLEAAEQSMLAGFEHGMKLTAGAGS